MPREIILANGVRLPVVAGTWTPDDALPERCPFFHPAMLAETDEAIPERTPERAERVEALWE
jgi:hypothetical protein